MEIKPEKRVNRTFRLNAGNGKPISTDSIPILKAIEVNYWGVYAVLLDDALLIYKSCLRNTALRKNK